MKVRKTNAFTDIQYTDGRLSDTNVKDTTTIQLYRDDHKELMMFKLQTDAKSAPDAMKEVIRLLKKELKNATN